MKPINSSLGLVAMLFCFAAFLGQAQDKADKGTINIGLTYHQLDTDLPIIKVSAKTKKDRKFEPVEGVEINLFLGSETSAGFMGRIKTNVHGAGSMALPERFKAQYDSSNSFMFIGTLTQNDRF